MYVGIDINCDKLIKLRVSMVLHLTYMAVNVGGTTQRNMLLIPLLDPAGVGDCMTLSATYREIDCKPRISLNINTNLNTNAFLS